MSEAKLENNAATQNITWRTNEPVKVNILAASLYASRAPVTPVSFTVSRRGGSVAKALTIKLRIQGCARNGVDYQTIPAEITIPAGASSAAIAVTPTAGVSGGIKNVLIEVEHVNDTTYMLGPDFQAQIAIIPSGAVTTAQPVAKSILTQTVPRRLMLLGAAPSFGKNGVGIAAYSLRGGYLGSLDKITGDRAGRNAHAVVVCRTDQ